MWIFKCSLVLLLINIARSENGNDLISAVMDNCVADSKPVTTCIRKQVLNYMNNILGVSDQSTGRQFSDETLDEQINARVQKYLNTHDFKVELPEFLFQNAVLTFRPSKGIADFHVDFPKPVAEGRADSEARGILKKKLLLPLLLLVKLKLKALTPLLLVIVGIKAVKAFIMSKLSLLLVVGFLIVQLCKKLGMAMPMSMPAAIATDIPSLYGPPTSSPYGPPTPAPYGAPAATPDTSYGPSWDSGTNGSNNGPYARWDSHNIAYSSYQPEAIKTTQS